MEHVTETKKRPRITLRVGTLIGILVIALAVAATIISGPHEPEYDNLFGPPLITPTVSVTNLLATQNVKQQLVYEGVNISVTQTLLASKFSDDTKETKAGTYVVRVMVNTTNKNMQPVGLDYANRMHLILPDGQRTSGQLSTVNEAVLPQAPQSGYIDFPVPQKVDLSTLQLQLGSQTVPLR
jgi:hypothetical protein